MTDWFFDPEAWRRISAGLRMRTFTHSPAADNAAVEMLLERALAVHHATTDRLCDRDPYTGELDDWITAETRRAAWMQICAAVFDRGRP
jgi:hypothetical protein